MFNNNKNNNNKSVLCISAQNKTEGNLKARCNIYYSKEVKGQNICAYKYTLTS